MGVHDVGALSLGEWVAIARQWNKAHGANTAQAPTADELDRAIMAARGLS